VRYANLFRAACVVCDYQLSSDLVLMVHVLLTTMGGDLRENDRRMTDIRVHLKALLRNSHEDAEESHKNWSE
jgi:hypothetical protein